MPTSAETGSHRPRILRPGLRSGQPPSQPRRLLLALMAGALGISVGTAAAASATDVSPGRLILRNAAFDSVRVEVRLGNSDRCEENMALAARTLKRGKAWLISVEPATVCWRIKPRPTEFDVSWTQWISTRLSQDSVIEKVL